MKHPFYFQNTTEAEHRAIGQHRKEMLKHRAHGTDGFLWVAAAFVAFAFLCRNDLPELPSLSVQEHPVASVRPAAYVTHDTPGQHTSLVNLIGDWLP